MCTATYGLFPLIVGPFGNRAIWNIFEVTLVSVPLMLPVAFLSGIFFTLIGAGLRKSCPSAATTTGLLTFANTTGAALGALTGGFLLLPFAGMEASFLALAGSYGIVAFMVKKSRIARSRIVYVAIAVYVLSLVLFPTGSMATRHLTTAASRWTTTPEWRVVDYREGVSETILYVEELLDGRRQDLRLVTNSFAMSSTRFRSRDA